MYIYDIIEKKRKAQSLTEEEINFVVNSYVKGKITHAQMSSLLMAIVLNGMNFNETKWLTLAMKNSSESLHFDEFIVDKHSTGGVSDSTTLILVPLLASLGVKIAKMSGRSLGFTGGTIDKLEVFEGYNANKSLDEFKKIINSINCSIISQTANLAYADKLIYSLRNETATVDSLPLIASSIMSKKLASGAKFLLLNVHYGQGAFMKTKKEAIKLARVMVKIGNSSGVKTRAVVSNMDTPLASGIGCSLEVESALNAIMGENSSLLKLSKILAQVILMEVKQINKKQTQNLIDNALMGEQVINKLQELIKAHGGNYEMVKDLNKLPTSKHKVLIYANTNGYVNKINALKVAKVVNHLKELNKEHSTKNVVGVKLLVNLGSYVKKDTPIAQINLNSKTKLDELKQELSQAFEIGKIKKSQPKLIAKII